MGGNAFNSHVQDTTVLQPEVFLTGVYRLLITHILQQNSYSSQGQTCSRESTRVGTTVLDAAAAGHSSVTVMFYCSSGQPYARHVECDGVDV
jgi:hypothetical protein